MSQPQTLIPYILEASGTSRVVSPEHSQFGGLTDVVKTRRKPLLIPDTRVEDLSLPELKSSSPVQSYLGLPLVADDQLVGSLEIGHLSPGVLGQNDHDLLQLVVTQAAYGIRNAILYANEQSRSAELGGLANLAQAFGPVQDYAGFMRRLVETISSLFSVEVLGFLLYDENKRTLEGQIPFQGLPAHIVEIFRTNIAAIAQQKNFFWTEKLSSRTTLQVTQLGTILVCKTLAQAASLRESVLMPMISEDQLVGYLQLSNHHRSISQFFGIGIAFDQNGSRPGDRHYRKFLRCGTITSAGPALGCLAPHRQPGCFHCHAGRDPVLFHQGTCQPFPKRSGGGLPAR